MLLISKKNHRKFNIYDNNLEFLLSMLTQNMVDNCNYYLVKGNELSSYNSVVIGLAIRNILQFNSLYELFSNGKVLPVINPTQEQLQKFKFNISPLSEKRKKFLELLSEFMINSDNILVE